jgi:DNA-binding response OmpR family regulator/DNA-binding CsgD family transcriptional regulator
MDEYQILIVDDDPRQLKVLTGNLIEFNPLYKLLIATNGKAGLEIARKNKPDLILMDWKMPGMSGLEAIQLLKMDKETMGIPIIMVTGTHYDVDKLKEAFEAGAIDFLCKPFNTIELDARISANIRHNEIFRKFIDQKDLLNEKESDLIEKEKQILKAEIIHHQKQLTMNTINLLKQSNLLNEITRDINHFIPFTTTEGKELIKELIFKINDKSNEHLWNEFEVCFENVHTGFYRTITEKIPEISVRERRLCAFLKMNMSAKEIASITFQSINSIDVAKHRLRTKIGVSSDEDLNNFLNSI